MVTHEENRTPYAYENSYRDDEIGLNELLLVIWKRKYFIAITIILCTVFAAGICVVKFPVQYKTECTVSLSFSGIEKHENPDGTPFEKGQLIAPLIISRIKEKLGQDTQNLKGHNLRGLLNVQPLIPSEIRTKMQEAKKKGDLFTFFPNQFLLSITTDGNRIFSENTRVKLLITLVDVYRQEFERKYGAQPVVTVNIADAFLDRYDYPEIITILQIEIDKLFQVLNSKIEQTGFLRDKETGLSFVDIRSHVEIIKNVDLSRAQASIETLKLVKNKENMINQYKYKIKKLQMLEDKKREEAKAAERILKKAEVAGRYAVSAGSGHYDKAVENTSLEIDSSFIENLVKNDYYSYLLKKTLDAEVAARNLELEKEYLEKEIEALRDKNNDKINGDKKSYENIRKLLVNISERIAMSAQKTNELSKRFMESQIKGAIKIIQGPETMQIRSMNITKIIMGVGVASLFLAVFLAFFLEYLRNGFKPIHKSLTEVIQN